MEREKKKIKNNGKRKKEKLHRKHVKKTKEVFPNVLRTQKK